MPRRLTLLPLSLVLACGVLLAGCGDLVVQTGPLPQAVPLPQPALVRTDAGTAARNFIAVVGRMEPMVEQECAARSRRLNCDYQIVVDDRPGQPPNAFQTLDRAGRPVIAFTLALIGEAQNQDELAFILGHEAAHHIAGHIPRSQQSALTGALIFGTLASLGGATSASVQAAQEVGATVGARRFSQEFELEADALGTAIAYNAGFDPERGAAFFARLPDPGNSFLGTHPPNADRIAVVQQTLVGLRGF